MVAAGTVTNEVAERQKWSLPGPGAGPRFVLAESACIFSLSGNEPPPSEWNAGRLTFWRSEVKRLRDEIRALLAGAGDDDEIPAAAPTPQRA